MCASSFKSDFVLHPPLWLAFKESKHLSHSKLQEENEAVKQC